MMKHRSVFRALSIGLLLSLSPLLAQCGGDAGLGTESGNPPRLEQQKLTLEVVAGGLLVVGAPGAVAPPGAAVRVTNLTTGERVQTTAGADGTIEVVIAGDLTDELEVSVSSGGRETSERLSLGAIGERTELSGVSCASLENVLVATMLDVIDAADASCSADADCASRGLGVASPCYYQCGTAILSRAGLAQASTQGPQRTAAVCAALDACDRPAPSSCPVESSALPACVEGRCQGVDPASMSCEESLDSIYERYAQLRASADKACAEDADCALANVATECVESCGFDVESVARDAVGALETAIRDEGFAAYCAAYLSRNCPLPQVNCPSAPNGPEAFCDAGTCAIRYQ
jgi:hypothetical protein